GLAVARRAGEEDAPLGPAAVILDPAKVGAVEVADGVLPEGVALLRRQDRFLGRRLRLAPPLPGDAVQPGIVAPVHGREGEYRIVLVVVVGTRRYDEADAVDLVEAGAERNADVVADDVRVPVADEDVVDGDERPAAGGFQQGLKEPAQLDGDR